MVIHHLLLVYLPPFVDDGDYESTLKDKAASYAGSVLRRFQHSVYSRALPSPFDEGGTNVLLCSEDPDRAIQELEKILAFQKSEVMYCLDRIEESTGKDFGSVIRRLYSDSFEAGYEFPMEHIRCVSQFLAGEYQISSRFYNTWEKTARLLPKDIDEIKKFPGDWALVQFVIEK